MDEPVLRVRDLCKSFGAVVATESLSLDLGRGQMHALIGPNGAGKTTVLNQIAGELAPDAGRIYFAGRDVTGMSGHRRARLGLARTFQVSSVFDRLSVADNLALAVQPGLGHSFRFVRQAAKDPALQGPVSELLERLALGELATRRAGELSHGDRRRLELGMALANNPKLLLLDEPMAGSGPDSAGELLHLLEALKGRMTVLLVEHDMDVVFALADTISVMVAGQCIASGSPEAVRADADVRRAYLGEEH